MLVKPLTIEELKQLQAKLFFSVTDKVTKISDGSVLNAIFFANAKLAQKTMKDILISQSHLFPDYSFGEFLDEISLQHGVSPRFLQPTPSTTFVRILGDVGTFYNKDLITFSGNGITFDLQENKTIGQEGFAYIKIKSRTAGSITNVEAYSINEIQNQPVGHKFVTNEYEAQGGTDAESDDKFRYRIKNYPNLAASNTLSKIENLFMFFDNRILRIFNGGSERNGKLVFYILGTSGQDFSQFDFSELTKKYLQFFSMNEINVDYVLNKGIELRNVNWKTIDLSFRCSLKDGHDPEIVRRNCQINVSKQIDFRNWKLGQKVEWDNLLQSIKQTEGIEYVSDNFFAPNTDLLFNYGEFPRIRGFQMLNLEGNLLSDGGLSLNPFFYPNYFDFSKFKLFYSNLT
jgi:hypothetical protein